MLQTSLKLPLFKQFAPPQCERSCRGPVLSSIKFLIKKFVLDLLSVFVNSIQFNTGYAAPLLSNVLYLTSVTVYTCQIWLYFIIIEQSSDVQEHTECQNNFCQGFSIFHWSLNGVCAHNFIKLSVLRAYSPCD